MMIDEGLAPGDYPQRVEDFIQFPNLAGLLGDWDSHPYAVFGLEMPS